MADIATWGVGNTLSSGIVQQDTFTSSHKTGEVRNEKGQVIRIQQYDKEYNGSFDLIVTSDATLPDVGESITLNKQSMYVTSIEIIENNTNFKRARIMCRASHKVTKATEVE